MKNALRRIIAFWIAIVPTIAIAVEDISAVKLVLQGLESYEKNDYDSAFAYYTRAAQAGDADAMMRIGYLYLEGKGRNRNEGLAKRWFIEAATRGDAAAMAALGEMFMTGNGVTKNVDFGFKWLGESAKRGNTYAMISIGLVYEKGNSVPQNYELAKRWFEEAAARGESYGFSNLGLAYRHGRGVKVDACKGHGLFKKAMKANSDNDSALLFLGQDYDGGSCVKADKSVARKYFQKASALGNNYAKVALENIDRPASNNNYYSRQTTTETRYEIYYEYKSVPAPIPPTPVAPISSFYGTPCWGC